MPQEIRHVLFNDREVCEMVFDLLASRGDHRRITAAKSEVGTDEAMGATVKLHYSEANSSERTTMLINSRDALSAAILYCRSRRVPLPMKADKSLQIVRGYLTLVLSSASAVRA